MESKDTYQAEDNFHSMMDPDKMEKADRVPAHDHGPQPRRWYWRTAKMLPTDPRDSRRVSYWRLTLAVAVLLIIGAYRASERPIHWFGLSSESTRTKSPANAKQPNFIFIITDDQDSLMGSLDYMPKLQAHMVEEGTMYTKHFCTVTICCPSRVSLLTGKAAHNTNVTDVKMPYGGYTKFVNEGLNDNYLPIWLQDAGYNTFYTGKLMNGHSVETYDSPHAKGWNSTNFFLDPNTYVYYNVTTQQGQDPPISHPGQYSTDIAARTTLQWLDEAAWQSSPFFMGVAPVGPHAEVARDPELAFFPPVPATRHKHMFPGLKVPRTPNFNPKVATGAGFVKTLKQQNDTVVAYNDEFYRARIQALQAVDELVDDVFLWLEANREVMENTYVIYTTDNGYHIGQHRLPPGKTCNVEEDINVPFIVRGPGVPRGRTYHGATTHTDIVPTLFELASIPLHDDFDGEPIPIKAKTQQYTPLKSEHVNVEFWGTALFEGIHTPFGDGLLPAPIASGFNGGNNTFKLLRIVADDYSLAYGVRCTNEHELYDMKNDPYRMHNIYPSNSSITHPATPGPHGIVGFLDIPISKIVARLDAALLALKACKGEGCRRPWKTLHPEGNVETLKQAMDPRYDDFYEREQEKVTFDACADGYLPWLEGAMDPVPFHGETEMVRGNGRFGWLARWEDAT